MTDPYGNTFSIHEVGDESVRIEFAYALPGMVETLNLNAAHGPHRIAAIIAALAAPIQ